MRNTKIQWSQIIVIGKTEYKYVYECTTPDKDILYRVSIGKRKGDVSGKNLCMYYTDKREAAIAADKYLIENGMSPVNILIKK